MIGMPEQANGGQMNLTTPTASAAGNRSDVLDWSVVPSEPSEREPILQELLRNQFPSDATEALTALAPILAKVVLIDMSLTRALCDELDRSSPSVPHLSFPAAREACVIALAPVLSDPSVALTVASQIVRCPDFSLQSRVIKTFAEHPECFTKTVQASVESSIFAVIEKLDRAQPGSVEQANCHHTLGALFELLAIGEGLDPRIEAILKSGKPPLSDPEARKFIFKKCYRLLGARTNLKDEAVCRGSLRKFTEELYAARAATRREVILSWSLSFGTPLVGILMARVFDGMAQRIFLCGAALLTGFVWGALFQIQKQRQKDPDMVEYKNAMLPGAEGLLEGLASRKQIPSTYSDWLLRLLATEEVPMGLRERAATVLGKINNADAIVYLSKLVTTGNRVVCCLAAEALLPWTTNPTIRELIEERRASHPDFEARGQLAELLKQAR